jgi:hypothetical protein
MKGRRDNVVSFVTLQGNAPPPVPTSLLPFLFHAYKNKHSNEEFRKYARTG